MIRRVLLVVLALGLIVVPSAQAAHKPSLGYYSCYQTQLNTSPITGATSYSSAFVDSFTLKAHGRYQVSFIPRDPVPKYSYAHGKIRFKGGPFDDDVVFWHLLGMFHPAGVTMPNSQLADPAQKFTVVLRDTRSDDSDVAPPMAEGGAVSFYYCARR